jgi:3'(2'), 5'-bisphosphate nucleotidase
LYGTLVIALRDKGTWATPLDGPEHFIALRVSACTQPDQARILGSYEAEHTNQGQVDEFARHLGVKTDPLRLDSQAKYALLAGGQGELLLRLLSPARLDYREKIWDQAAGSLIIQEAGGKVTDLDGLPFDFSTGRALRHNRGMLASNGFLHQKALETLRMMGG